MLLVNILKLWMISADSTGFSPISFPKKSFRTSIFRRGRSFTDQSFKSAFIVGFVFFCQKTYAVFNCIFHQALTIYFAIFPAETGNNSYHS